jgi:anti-anti-sigma regulatory factor
MPEEVGVSRVLVSGASDGSGTLVVRPRGRFDLETARSLLRTVSTMAALRVPRAQVDLGGVQSFSDDALFAVTGVRRLAERLPGRICLVAPSGPGARLLRRSELLAP